MNLFVKYTRKFSKFTLKATLKYKLFGQTIKHIKYLQTSIDLFWIRYLTTKTLKIKVVKFHKKLLQII